MSLKEVNDYFQTLCVKGQVMNQDADVQSIVGPELASYILKQPERRRNIYGELTFQNILTLLQTAYSASFQFLTQEQQHSILRRYLQDVGVDTPYYRLVAGSFYQWVRKHQDEVTRIQPFLFELLDYEFCTYDLLFQSDTAWGFHSMNKELATCHLTLNQNFYLRHYSYPVHLYVEHSNQDDLQNREAFVLIYRHPKTWNVGTYDLGEKAFKFYNFIQKNKEWNVGEILTSYLNENQDVGMDELMSFLKTLHSYQLVNFL